MIIETAAVQIGERLEFRESILLGVSRYQTPSLIFFLNQMGQILVLVSQLDREITETYRTVDFGLCQHAEKVTVPLLPRFVFAFGCGSFLVVIE